MRLHHMLFPSLFAVALVAACNDSPPVAPVTMAASPAALADGIPASDERVTITRTVEASVPDEKGRDKPRKVTRWTRTFTRGAGRVSLHAGDSDGRSRLRGRGVGRWSDLLAGLHRGRPAPRPCPGPSRAPEPGTRL